MNKLIRYLNYHIQGCVYDKPSVLAAYAKDKSVLKITPRLVAVPDTTEDVQFLVRFSNELSMKGYQLPVTVRGSGLDETGADLGSGMIISTEKLNNVQEIDDRARLVRVQAGCTLEKLNSMLAVYGLTLPVKADPKETIGGLISNFHSDPYSKKYGSIFYFVDRIELVLSNGDLIQTVSYTKHGLKNAKKKSTYESKIYRDLDELLDKSFDVVDDIADGARDHAGYSQVTKVEKGGNFDLLPLLFGAQGTLGVITEVILRVEPVLRRTARILMRFSSMEDAAIYANRIRDYHPLEVRLVDSRIVRIAASAGKTFDIISKPIPGSFYVLTAFEDSHFKNRRQVKRAVDAANMAKAITIEDETNRVDFDNLSDVIDVYVNDEKPRPAIVGEARIPLSSLATYAGEVDVMEKTYDRHMPIYGSMLTDLYEVRPSFDMTSVSERKRAMEFLRDYIKLVDYCKGSITGGEAEGRIKAAVALSKMSPKRRDLYVRIKNIFDPNNILNPDVKLGGKFSDVVRHLRTDEVEGLVQA